MLVRIFTFLIGFSLVILGFSTIVLYINLFSFGYNFKEYISFIIKLPEFYVMIVGFIILNLSILIKGGKK